MNETIFSSAKEYSPPAVAVAKRRMNCSFQNELRRRDLVLTGVARAFELHQTALENLVIIRVRVSEKRCERKIYSDALVSRFLGAADQFGANKIQEAV